MPSYSQIKKYKETPFYASFCKASYTIEATIIMPLFITLMVFGIFTFRILQVQAGVQKAIDSASRRAAVLGTIDINEKELLSDTALIGSATIYSSREMLDNKVPFAYVNGGALGINYLESNADGNYVTVVANYGMKFPIGLLGKHVFPVTQVSRNRKWVGFDPNENNWDNEYVYITPTGVVYHTNYMCTYLNPSVRPVSAGEVKNERNLSGGIYYSCTDCGGDRNSGTVYITDYGTNYHSDVNCTGIKRTIQKVLLKDVENEMCICSKCSGVEE